MKLILFIICLIFVQSSHKFKKAQLRLKKEDDSPAPIKKVAGFIEEEKSFPVVSCNQNIGVDGELLDDIKNTRKSAPAHLTMTMWVLNIFAEKGNMDTLLRSMDLANIDLKFDQYQSAHQCVKIKAKREKKEEGFCFANAEIAQLFKFAVWNFKVCREDGVVPKFTLMEMDHLTKEHSKQQKFQLECMPGSDGCDRVDDGWGVVPQGAY